MQRLSVRLSPITTRAADYGPAVPACCNACRTCTTMNVMGVVLGGLALAGSTLARLVGRVARQA